MNDTEFQKYLDLLMSMSLDCKMKGITKETYINNLKMITSNLSVNDRLNPVDAEYFRLVRLVLEKGKTKKNRTGVDTIGVFGAQAKFNIDMNAFPILTTKKVFMKGIIHELLWFLKGDTNIKYLVDNDVHIWDEWAYKKYYDIHKVNDTVEGDRWMKHNPTLPPPIGDTVSMFTQEEFIQNIKTNPDWLRWGELGMGTYGGMWRDFPHFKKTYSSPTEKCGVGDEYEPEGVDQIQKVLNKLKTNPDDRRMIVSAWHPYWVDHCALPPCHCLFHFNTEELSDWEKEDIGHKATRKLNCLLYQRSCDLGLGVPFNITSYCLLTAMMAQSVGMVPGTFTHTYGDLHIYKNHVEALAGQLERDSKPLPKLIITTGKGLFDLTYDDIKLENYVSHPAIKMDVAV